MSEIEKEKSNIYSTVHENQKEVNRVINKTTELRAEDTNSSVSIDGSRKVSLPSLESKLYPESKQNSPIGIF